MRILHIIPEWIDQNARGGQLYTYNLASEQAKRNDVAVMFSRNDRVKELRIGTYDNIKTFSIGREYDPTLQSTVTRYTDQDANKAFEEVLDIFYPDIIHFHHLLNLSLDFPKLAKRRAIPMVYTLHDFWLLCPQFFLADHKQQICASIDHRKCFACCLARSERAVPKEQTLSWLNWTVNKRIDLASKIFWNRPQYIKSLFKDIDLFLACANHLRNFFIQEGCPPDKVVLNRYGLTLKPKSSVKIPKDSSKLRFAFIGTVASYKGMDVLIEAFKPIKNAELWIYGKYSGTPYPEMASENPNISFRGELLQEDKEQAFDEMDVLIAPSIMVDPYPLVIQEAALQKVPVIVSNIGGLAEQVIDGKNGLLFERGNSTDLNQKIRYLIDNPQEITRLSGQASSIKSMHKDAQDIENYYQIILEKKAKMIVEKHWNQAEVS